MKNGKRTKDDKAFGAAFIVGSGFAFLFLVQLFFLGPIPGHYVEVYGIGYAVFAIAMLVAGLTILNEWSENAGTSLAALLGIILLVEAFNIAKFSLSKSPIATMFLFGVPGLAALLLPGVNLTPQRKWLLMGAMLLFLAFGALAMYSGISAIGGHIASALEKAAAAAAAAKTA